MCAADDDSDVDSEVEPDGVTLEFDDNGYPLLPAMADMSLEDMKQYIRRYVTIIYRECLFICSKLLLILEVQRSSLSTRRPRFLGVPSSRTKAFWKTTTKSPRTLRSFDTRRQ